eukprot:3751728-Amphidinium_carterae.1
MGKPTKPYPLRTPWRKGPQVMLTSVGRFPPSPHGHHEDHTKGYGGDDARGCNGYGGEHCMGGC